MKNIAYKFHQKIDFSFFSDGITDQFGGEKDKKFGSKRLKDIINEKQNLPLQEHHLEIINELNNWKKETEQVDDMVFISCEF